MSGRDQLLKLHDEFYKRLEDARDCPKCAKEFIEWLIPDGNGLDIENTRGEEWEQLCDDYYHVENIYFCVTNEYYGGSGDTWFDLSCELKDAFSEKAAT